MKFVLTGVAIKWLHEQMCKLKIGGDMAFPRSGLIYNKEDTVTLRLVDIVDPDDPASREVSRSYRHGDRVGTIITGSALGILVIDTLPEHPVIIED